MSYPYIVGITGGSGSGKTLFLQKLAKAFDRHEICFVSQDNYYKPRENQPIDNEGVINFDTPNSIDFQQYTNDLIKLRDGEKIIINEYAFNNPLAEKKVLEIKPAAIIVVEGIFVFHHVEIADLLDFRIFIDTMDYIKLKRRILRDKHERGYDMEDVLYRYEKHVMPTYRKYIEPFKHNADIIIPNNENFDKALEAIVAFLKTKI